MNTNQDKTSQDDSKLAWAKPELEIVSVKEQTLAGAPGVIDAGLLS